MRVGVLTVSSSRGSGEDASGDALAEAVAQSGHELSGRSIVSDSHDAIAAAIRELAATSDVVLTTGGTGVTQDDVTPEATKAVVDRLVPGIAEAIRMESLQHTPMAMLSRGIAGTLGTTLIVNLPGSPAACRQCFSVIEPLFEHASAQLRR
jgi:molybdopterin adenylyltransferase